MFVICISPPSASSDGIPAPNGPFFDVPVRWCVVEGSPALVSGADTDALLLLRLAGATWNIYNPDPNPDSFNRPGSNTLIGLSSRIPNQRNPFQRIADPCPPSANCPGELGDILDEMPFRSDEEDAVISACRAAWRTNLPDNTGIIAVNVRRLVGRSGAPTGTLGVTAMPYACNAIISANICRDPKITNPGDMAAVILTDASFTGSSDDFLVAHEFGHALGLGHGDGIDNNGNGVFDECCDPSEIDTGKSLMSAGNGSLTITELQQEVARAIAFVTPGTRYETLAFHPGPSPQKVEPLPPRFDKIIPSLTKENFSCGPNTITYSASAGDNRQGNGVRCVKIQNIESMPHLTWYGEGQWQGQTYRHIGEATPGCADRPLDFCGAAADIHGNGESFNNNFPGKIIGFKATNGNWPAPNEIRISGAWNEVWNKVTAINYVPLLRPTTCGSNFDEYAVSDLNNRRQGAGIRCVLRKGSSPYTTAWFGNGEWEGRTYSHVGIFRIGHAISGTIGGGVGGASDLCNSALGQFCNNFRADSLRFTSICESEGEGRPRRRFRGFKVQGAWSEVWDFGPDGPCAIER